MSWNNGVVLGFLSGWYLSASFLYALRTSKVFASSGTPSNSKGAWPSIFIPFFTTDEQSVYWAPFRAPPPPPFSVRRFCCKRSSTPRNTAAGAPVAIIDSALRAMSRGTSTSAIKPLLFAYNHRGRPDKSKEQFGMGAEKERASMDSEFKRPPPLHDKHHDEPPKLQVLLAPFAITSGFSLPSPSSCLYCFQFFLPRRPSSRFRCSFFSLTF